MQKRDFRACRRVLQVKSFSEGWKRMDQATFTLLADRYMDMVFRLARSWLAIAPGVAVECTMMPLGVILRPAL